jgi:O-antigen ligase
MTSITNKIKISNFHKEKMIFLFVVLCAIMTGMSIAYGNWLYAGVMFIPLVIYLCIMKPFIFPFGVYVFLLPFDEILKNKTGGALTKYLAILTVLVFFLKGAIEKKFKQPDIIVIWWILFIIFSLLSITWAIQPELIFGRIKNAFGFLLLYLLMASYQIQKKDYDLLKRYIFIGGSIAALLITYSYFNHVSAFGYGDRVSLSFGENRVSLNSQAFTLLIPFTICISVILEQKTKLMKGLFVIILLVIIFSIILTGSRGNLSAALTILLIYFLYIRNVKKKIVFGFTIVLALLIIIPLIPEFMIERITSSSEDHASGRFDIWIVGLKALKKYWLYGAGLDNFPKAFTEFVTYQYGYLNNDRASHNIFLGIFVELGIIGISLLILGFVKHYRAIGISSQTANTIMLKAAFWGIIIAGLTIDIMWDKETWLLWMMILMNRYIEKKQIQSVHSSH